MLYFAFQQPLFHALAGPHFPPLAEIIRNQSLLFVNSNEFLELPRPLSSKIIHIGGIAFHPDELKHGTPIKDEVKIGK
jgi:hypothetical protein